MCSSSHLLESLLPLSDHILSFPKWGNQNSIKLFHPYKNWGWTVVKLELCPLQLVTHKQTQKLHISLKLSVQGWSWNRITTISSYLIQELEWEQSVPYLNDKNMVCNNFQIFSSTRINCSAGLFSWALWETPGLFSSYLIFLSGVGLYIFLSITFLSTI